MSMSFDSLPDISGKLQSNFVTRDLTTFRIGGPADLAAWPESTQDYLKLLLWSKVNNIPVTFLGGGSNVLISDEGIRGLLIISSAMNGLERKEAKVLCGSGIQVNELNDYLINEKLSGLEFSGGLPGSLGGAVWMNARAYGGEFADIVEWVEAITPKNEILTFDRPEMEFAYKKSVFQKDGLFITQVLLNLKAGNKKKIQVDTQKNIDDRNSKQQNLVYSAGCAFKNNYECGIPSGKLIEQVGLKGTKKGDAEIFEQHANFFINHDNASSNDIIYLMNLAQKRVYEKLNIKIKAEVQFLGEHTDIENLV